MNRSSVSSAVARVDDEAGLRLQAITMVDFFVGKPGWTRSVAEAEAGRIAKSRGVRTLGEGDREDDYSMPVSDGSFGTEPNHQARQASRHPDRQHRSRIHMLVIITRLVRLVSFPYQDCEAPSTSVSSHRYEILTCEAWEVSDHRFVEYHLQENVQIAAPCTKQ